MTIGSLTENSDNGDHHTPAKLNVGPAPAWDLWRRIAAKDPAFGRPDVFGAHIPETKWESATVTTLDARIPQYIQKIAKRDPFNGSGDWRHRDFGQPRLVRNGPRRGRIVTGDNHHPDAGCTAFGHGDHEANNSHRGVGNGHATDVHWATTRTKWSSVWQAEARSWSSPQ